MRSAAGLGDASPLVMLTPANGALRVRLASILAPVLAVVPMLGVGCTEAPSGGPIVISASSGDAVRVEDDGGDALFAVNADGTPRWTGAATGDLDGRATSAATCDEADALTGIATDDIMLGSATQEVTGPKTFSDASGTFAGTFTGTFVGDGSGLVGVGTGAGGQELRFDATPSQGCEKVGNTISCGGTVCSVGLAEPCVARPAACRPFCIDDGSPPIDVDIAHVVLPAGRGVLRGQTSNLFACTTGTGGTDTTVFVQPNICTNPDCVSLLGFGQQRLVIGQGLPVTQLDDVVREDFGFAFQLSEEKQALLKVFASVSADRPSTCYLLAGSDTVFPLVRLSYLPADFFDTW